MSDISLNTRIFGRYSREECGLPAKQWGRPNRLHTALRTLIMLAVLIAAGWLGGVMSARWRETWVNGLPYMVSVAEPGAASSLLSTGAMYVRALPDRGQMRLYLAAAAVIEAEHSPQRLGYYANAVNLLREAGSLAGEPPEREFDLQVFAAGVYGEMEDYESTFSALDQAEAALKKIGTGTEPAFTSRRLMLANARAYFLAIAGEKNGGNPGTALELAQLAISSRDELPGGGFASGSAAFLDTLAAARYASGDIKGALSAQTLALGLADPGELEVYVRHYDQYRQAATD